MRMFTEKTEYYGERNGCVSTAGWHVKLRPGFAVKGGAGQVQGEPCRGSRGEQPLAGRDRAKTCAVIKDRAGAAEKVPQNRPHIIEQTVHRGKRYLRKTAARSRATGVASDKKGSAISVADD